MKLSESRLREFIQEEISRINEGGDKYDLRELEGRNVKNVYFDGNVKEKQEVVIETVDGSEFRLKAIPKDYGNTAVISVRKRA